MISLFASKERPIVCLVFTLMVKLNNTYSVLIVFNASGVMISHCLFQCETLWWPQRDVFHGQLTSSALGCLSSRSLKGQTPRLVLLSVHLDVRGPDLGLNQHTPGAKLLCVCVCMSAYEACFWGNISD